MNNLLIGLVRALRHHHWLRLLGGAFMLSSVGNGLTQVVVFGQLLRWHASPSALTLAYVLATLPGFFGSFFGEKGCRRVPPLRLLILTELLGMFALILPLLGMFYHNIPAMLAVQSVAAFLAGMSYPALTLTFKQGLSAEELPAATCMETLIFSAQVLLGTGLGVLLFEVFSPLTLLSIDAVSFVAAILLLAATARHIHLRPLQEMDTPPQVAVIRWAGLSILQKRSLLLLPALAAVGSPAMALLPAIAQQIRPGDATGLALPLLFARSLGQLCGPLLLNGERLRHYAKSNRHLLMCLGIFLAAYGALPLLAAEKTTALGLIFVAHLASNVVFALGTFSVLAYFPAQSVSGASAKAWRWQTLTAALATTLAAGLAAQWGATQSLYAVSLTSLAAVALILVRYRQ
ncbi:MFS transporter [Acerihabitans sp. TG2]|uniref:MFS transporter n=1 Tax=Acerihabitans sp. TG2 TaxID=3096008 RepID=UPI002B22A59F|nr:MFS transporter [Acerihabitans sp. TG2]MEA9391319.1 MFS transporter [Acerihabitans sp. TG2]